MAKWYRKLILVYCRNFCIYIHLYYKYILWKVLKMSLYSWPLLDACTIKKHASAVFRLQISQMLLQRLAGEMNSTYKIGVGKPVYCCCSSKHKATWSGVGHGRKALAHLRMCRDRTEVVYWCLFSTFWYHYTMLGEWLVFK